MASCAPQGPDLYIGQEQFRETFCADVPVDVADVMFATQRPLSLAALTENATAAGWKTKPSWFLVSEHDNAIPPDAERFMAERMGAVTESISGSHTAFIASPVRVADFITKASLRGPHERVRVHAERRHRQRPRPGVLPGGDIEGEPDMNVTSLELRSEITSTGQLRLSLEERDVAPPGPDEVVVRVEAALAEALDPQVIRRYQRVATGEKYLLRPYSD
jgi:hypothetical protein